MSCSKSTFRTVAAFLLYLLVNVGCTERSGGECPMKKTALNLVAMAPFPDARPGLMPGWQGGPAVIPAVQLAVKHINSNCDLLREYKLQLSIDDSGCDVVSKATISIVGTIHNRTHVAGIVGPGCSEASFAVGRLLAHKDLSLINIAPSATSPLLVNTTIYPNTFRPIPSSLGFIAMYKAIVKDLKFKRIAILFEEGRQFHVTTASSFQTSLGTMINNNNNSNESNITSFSISNVAIPLNELRNEYRIIFVFGGTAIVQRVMCAAYHKRMLYPHYQFIFLDRRLSHFLGNVSFVLDGTMFNCTEGEMRQALSGNLLSLLQLTRRDKDTVLVNDRNFTQFEAEYQSALKDYMDVLDIDSVVDTQHYTGYYDSTWAFALALNASEPRLRSEFNTSLSDYSFGYPEHTAVIREELFNVSFEGVRGMISFSREAQDGENVTVIELYQVPSGNEPAELVGTYNPSRNMCLDMNDNVFINDKFDVLVVAIPLYVKIVAYILIFLLLAVTAFFHVINTLWVTEKSMRVTSPSLNHVIFSGCYLYFVSAFLILFHDTNMPVMFGVTCGTIIWCESLALTLILGTICVKSWRIFRIFSHNSAKVLNNLEDYRLIAFICLLLVVDFIFNIAWNLVDPWYGKVVPNDQLKMHTVCSCDHLEYWLPSLGAQKVILVLGVLYLSILTRRIPKREYKQTKSTNTLIYVLLFVYSFTIPTYVIFRESLSIALVTVSYLALCFKNVVSIVLCTVLIFLPPALPVLKEKWWMKFKAKCLGEKVT